MTLSGDSLVQGERSAAQRWLDLARVWLPRLLLGGLAAVHLAVLYYIFWARLSYPLDLEWMESGTLVHAKRVMDGQGIYVAPSVDFASFCYTPLYPGLLGVLGKLFGLSYTLGRALSVFAITCGLAFILHAARRSTRDARALGAGSRGRWLGEATADAWVAGLMGMAVIAAAYPLTGGWYDLVRNDSLFVALCLGGLFLCVAGRDRLALVALAGVLLGLAFFAKQTAVLLIVAAGLGMLVLRPLHLVVLVLVVGAVAGGGTLILNHVTDGWFWFYVYDLHQAHQTDTALIWPKTPLLLWERAPWLYGGCLVGLVVWIFAQLLRRCFAPHTAFWLLAAVAGVAAASLGRATQWSYDNAYIPGVVFPAALLVVSASESLGLLAVRPGDEAFSGWRGWLLGRSWLLRLIGGLPLLLAALHLLFTGLPETRRFVPDRAQWAQARRFLVELKRLGRHGEVFVPYHPYYSVLAGGRGHGHIMNVNDVNFTRRLARGAKGGWLGSPTARRKRVLEARRRLVTSIRRALGQGRFAVVIHDRNLVARWSRRGVYAAPRRAWAYTRQLPGLFGRYRLEWDLAWDRAAPRTLSGNPAAPRYVWKLPRRLRPPAGGRVVFDFERTSHAGWSVTGSAFGSGPVSGLLWDPKRNRAQGLVAGIGGQRYVSSFHRGDASTGQLRSPPFVLDRPWLSLRLGGGRDPQRLTVQLRVDGRVVHQATGRNQERLRTIGWDVRSLKGRRARLEVTDQAKGSWGHILVDEIWLVRTPPRPRAR